MEQSSLEKVGYLELMSFESGFEQRERVDITDVWWEWVPELVLRRRKTWGSERGWQCRGDQRDGGCGEDRGDVVKGGGSGNDTGCRVLDQLELVGEFVRWEGDKTEIFFFYVFTDILPNETFPHFFARLKCCMTGMQEDSSKRIYPLDHLIV